MRVVMLAEAINLQSQTLIAGLRTEEGDVCVPVVVLRGAARKGVVPLPNKLFCPRSDLSGNARIGKRRVGDVVGVAAVWLIEQQAFTVEIEIAREVDPIAGSVARRQAAEEERTAGGSGGCVVPPVQLRPRGGDDALEVDAVELTAALVVDGGEVGRAVDDLTHAVAVHVHLREPVKGIGGDAAVGDALCLPGKGNGHPRLPRGQDVRERRRRGGLKVRQRRRRGMKGVDARHQRGTVDPKRRAVAGIAGGERRLKGGREEAHAVEATEEGVLCAVPQIHRERVVRGVSVAALRVKLRLGEGVEGGHELRRKCGQLCIDEEARAAAIAELQVENVLCAQSLRPVQKFVDDAALGLCQIVGERGTEQLVQELRQFRVIHDGDGCFVEARLTFNLNLFGGDQRNLPALVQPKAIVCASIVEAERIKRFFVGVRERRKLLHADAPHHTGKLCLRFKRVQACFPISHP